jgi:hypothetical protein
MSNDRRLREEIRERREQQQLRDTAWKLSSQRFLKTATETQLRLAAALSSHEGHLGMVAMFAKSELIRRGLKP